MCKISAGEALGNVAGVADCGDSPRKKGGKSRMTKPKKKRRSYREVYEAAIACLVREVLGLLSIFP